MNTNIKTIALGLAVACGVFSCSKNEGNGPDGENGNSDLTGKLIYSFSGDVYQSLGAC